MRSAPLPLLVAATLGALVLVACPKRKDATRIPEREAPKSCEEMPEMIWSELPRPDAGSTDAGTMDAGTFAPFDGGTDAGT